MVKAKTKDKNFNREREEGKPVAARLKGTHVQWAVAAAANGTALKAGVSWF